MTQYNKLICMRMSISSCMLPNESDTILGSCKASSTNQNKSESLGNIQGYSESRPNHAQKLASPPYFPMAYSLMAFMLQYSWSHTI